MGTYSLFYRQFYALCRKNWQVIAKDPFNFSSVLTIPLGFAVFMSYARYFFLRNEGVGIGEPLAIEQLSTSLGTMLLPWTVDIPDATTENIDAAENIMNHIAQTLNNEDQQSNLQYFTDIQSIYDACPQNFQERSSCFAAVQWISLSPENYTYVLRADQGLTAVNVEENTSDFEKRLLPLQWALDSAIIQQNTATSPPTPSQWPYTLTTDDEQDTENRITYVRNISDTIALAFYSLLSGIVYHLADEISSERANSLTAHLDVMGCMKSARLTSWLVSIGGIYTILAIVMGGIYSALVFTETNAGLVIILHLLFALSLSSWTIFMATPINSNPQLSAIVNTGLAMIFAVIGLVIKVDSVAPTIIVSILFPPSQYVFGLLIICEWEIDKIGTNATSTHGNANVPLIAIFIIQIFTATTFLLLAALVEKFMYDARSKPNLTEPNNTLDSQVAISLNNVQKVYNTGRNWATLGIRKSEPVNAVEQLSFNVKLGEVFCLLGNNGSGKSTILQIIAGLQSLTSGTITLNDQLKNNSLGIAPQKNVLWNKLTCNEHLQLWRDIKARDDISSTKDNLELLKQCDLSEKVETRAANLSGGMKRKLQLACAIVGGSQCLLLDEITSGLDPLSRRAIWKIINSVRGKATVIHCTHFLDEADLLGDDVCILAAPGRVLCNGSPVTLKTELGQGYILHISTLPQCSDYKKIYNFISHHIPEASFQHIYSGSNKIIKVHLNSKDTSIVTGILTLLRDNKESLGIKSFDIEGSSLEEVFLKLMYENGGFDSISNAKNTLEMKNLNDVEDVPSMDLATATSINLLEQALTIVKKRLIIARTSWIMTILPVIAVLCVCCIPLVFMENRVESCAPYLEADTNLELLFANSPYSMQASSNSSYQVLVSPSDALDPIGINGSLINPVSSRSDFVDYVRSNYLSMEVGGISYEGSDANSSSLMAYSLEDNSKVGITMLNMISNNYLQQSGSSLTIDPKFQGFPARSFLATAQGLKWAIFFVIGMCVYPSFSILYPTDERISHVKALQLSNGATPLGLWIGHFFYETPFIILSSTLITIVFATASDQFHGLGYFWLCFVLYGWAGTLFAFLGSTFSPTPLSGFAGFSIYNLYMVVFYLMGQFLVLTYQLDQNSSTILTVLYFTMSLLSPAICITRMVFVSINLFSLLCNRQSYVSNFGGILQFGGVIVYLIGWIIFLFSFLIWYDSGGSEYFYTKKSNLFKSGKKRNYLKRALTFGFTFNFKKKDKDDDELKTDEKVEYEDNVIQEANRVQDSQDNLRVLNLSKAFSAKVIALKDISFGVSSGECFALIGPNGSGKTTTFDCIRGELSPDSGDAFIEGNSISRNRNAARTALGVCPQFDATDKLTVREQLTVYAHLKGISKKKLDSNVQTIMQRTGLIEYSDRYCRKLSGGNKRKLSLAISLLGSPSVLLVDEFSSGMDPATKRVMWDILRSVQQDRALVVTSHSMEETEALAHRVGIIARRMLTVASPTQLRLNSETYELHLLARYQTPEVSERIKKFVIQTFPGAKKVDDVATRFEIPLTATGHEGIKSGAGNDDDFVHEQKDNNTNNNGISYQLPNLFETMEREAESLGIEQWHIAPVSLESIFIRKVKQHKVQEEDAQEKHG